MKSSLAQLEALKSRNEGWLMTFPGVVSVVLYRGRLPVIVEDEHVRESLPREVEGHELRVLLDGPAYQQGPTS